jgi:hypothetical protein
VEAASSIGCEERNEAIGGGGGGGGGREGGKEKYIKKIKVYESISKHIMENVKNFAAPSHILPSVKTLHASLIVLPKCKNISEICNLHSY